VRNAVAFVDEPLLAREFGPGDTVRKAGTRDFVLSPYVGRVVYSNHRTGKVQVQWPWGSEQESPSELVKDASGLIPPSFIDQTYVTWDAAESLGAPPVVATPATAWKRVLSSSGPMSARIAGAYELRTQPLWQAACKEWHSGTQEVEAFQRLAASMGDAFGLDAVRVTVANLYGHGRRVSLYWKDTKRKYRVTQREKSSGKVVCPRCKGLLKPRTYRAGQKVLLCRTCGFSIHPEDIL
jgi:ribosomal protein L37AE/L43A